MTLTIFDRIDQDSYILIGLQVKLNSHVFQMYSCEMILTSHSSQLLVVIFCLNGNYPVGNQDGPFSAYQMIFLHSKGWEIRRDICIASSGGWVWTNQNVNLWSDVCLIGLGLLCVHWTKTRRLIQIIWLTATPSSHMQTCELWQFRNTERWVMT